MKQKHFLACTAFLTAMAMAPMASAAPVTPTYDSFGTLSEATFGGTGIPNDAVAIASFGSGSSLVTIGITAHQRYSNPPLSNDGEGTFFATTGKNDGLTDPPQDAEGSRWNIAWYIGGPGTSKLSFLTYVFEIGVDTDPSVNADLTWVPVVGVGLGNYEDSQNLSFYSSSFDPDAEGEYSFVLRASSFGIREVGRAAIVVKVQDSTVPAPSVAALFGIGLLSAGVAGRRKQRQKS